MHEVREQGPGGVGDCGPQRTCIVTRTCASPHELIRFVRSPEGIAVPDLAGKLPGRGAWVGCSSVLVDKAGRSGSFSRAFRAKTDVPVNLSAQVDALLLRRTIEALSLVNKAGALVSGYNKVDAAIGAGNVSVLIQAADASLAPKRRLARKLSGVATARGHEAKTFELLTIDELSLALGRPNVVHAAVIGSRSTALFARAADRLARYRAVTPFAVADKEGPDDQGDASGPARAGSVEKQD